MNPRIKTLIIALALVLTGIVIPVVAAVPAEAAGTCTGDYHICATPSDFCYYNSSSVGVGVRFNGQPIGSYGGVLQPRTYFCSTPFTQYGVSGLYIGPGFCTSITDWIKDSGGYFFFYQLLQAHSYHGPVSTYDTQYRSHEISIWAC